MQDPQMDEYDHGFFFFKMDDDWGYPYVSGNHHMDMKSRRFPRDPTAMAAAKVHWHLPWLHVVFPRLEAQPIHWQLPPVSCQLHCRLTPNKNGQKKQRLTLAATMLYHGLALFWTLGTICGFEEKLLVGSGFSIFLGF